MLTERPDNMRADQTEPPPRWGQVIVGAITWFVPAIIFIMIVASCSGLIFTPIAPFGGALLAVFIAFATNHVIRVRKRQRALTILGYIENAVRLNLPLDRFLMAAEHAERGGARRQLSDLRRLLARGVPVAAAITTAVPEFPERIVAEIAVAERMGRLQPTLGRLVEENVYPRTEAAPDVTPFYRFYPFGVLFAIFSLFMFLTIFVFPKFREIFKDFRLALPNITTFFFNVGNFLVGDTYLAVILLIVITLGIVVFIGLQLQRIFAPHWPVPRPTALRDWVLWHLPFWRAAERHHGMASLCMVLADAVRAGLPLQEGLNLALALPVNQGFRRQIHLWRLRMDAGAAPDTAAADAHLPPLFVGFVATAVARGASADASSLADVFGFLGRHYRDRFSRAIILIRAASEPLVVLAMGVAVGTFIYAMFLPLVYLINSTMDYYPGGVL